jgi:hypothetical protein
MVLSFDHRTGRNSGKIKNQIYSGNKHMIGTDKINSVK